MFPIVIIVSFVMKELSMLRQIAYMYYIEGRSQSYIAEVFGVSRSQISKMLKRGRDAGIVSIEISDTDESCLNLALELKNRFSLRDVIVVPSGSMDAGKADTGKKVGAKAAEYLKKQLKDGMSIGVEWGTSLYHMIEEISYERSYDITAVQMHGIIESNSMDIEGSALAKQLGRKLGGKVKLLQAPMVVETKQLKEMLISERKIAETLKAAREVDIACIGIGTNELGTNVLTKSGYISDEESRRIQHAGGTAMVSGWFLDANGHVIDSSANERIIGVHPELFKGIPLVMGVAYGKHKRNGILSALRGGFINVLVTDEQAAAGVLNEDDIASQIHEIPEEKLLCMYTRMYRTRVIDERLKELFEAKKMHGTTHLSIGQEASSVVPGCALDSNDLVFGTHRGHGHALGRGMTSYALFAEMFGKASGCAGGKGGSMHLVDKDKGIMGMDAVVAGTLPVAAGAALSAQLLKKKQVTAAFLGDGATNEGAFHEALNLASVWRLPIIFICENNLYGLSCHIKRSMNVDNIAVRASSYGIPGWTIDGNDAVEIYRTIRKARSYVLEKGSVLIVQETYRISGHSKSDKNAYRTDEEIAYWRRFDPLERFRNVIMNERMISHEEMQDLERGIDTEVRAAEGEAAEAPEPDVKVLEEDVYA